MCLEFCWSGLFFIIFWYFYQILNKIFFFLKLSYMVGLTYNFWHVTCLAHGLKWCDEKDPGESIGLKFIPSQSELLLFRFIPIFVSERMRIIPNRSEKRFVSRLMKNGQKWIRLNPITSKTSFRMNPNQSETKFSTQINPSSEWSKPNFQSELIWFIPTLD